MFSTCFQLVALDFQIKNCQETKTEKYKNTGNEQTNHGVRPIIKLIWLIVFHWKKKVQRQTKKVQRQKQAYRRRALAHKKRADKTRR